jgi:steroid delta-isomerase-like uncharacterized protein
MKRVIIGAALALLLLPPALGQATDDVERNKEQIRQQIDLLNRGDLKAAVLYFAEDMTHQGRPVTRESRRRVLEDIYTTFPDWHMQIEEMIGEDESVVVRLKVSGTHRGVQKLAVNGALLVGAEPTHKRFEVEHIHWYKLHGGKIVEHYATRDDIGMTRQLGLLPLVGLPKSR